MRTRPSMVMGAAVTGAKFTPENHRPTGDVLLDKICSGSTIKTSTADTAAEARALYDAGCRYFHYHARNPVTQEQSTDNRLYQAVSRAVQHSRPGMLISFGASRNGREVRESIRKYGEWERVSQCALPLHLGGAHYVTQQAAVELQVAVEMERQGVQLGKDAVNTPAFAAAARAYRPGGHTRGAGLETYSTSGGADYGKTSPRTQFDVYANGIQARRRLGLFHEVEWVQLDRSHAMTRFAVERPEIGLGSSGQLNITLLFGFSPLLPFPRTYAEFRTVVGRAKSLEWDADSPGERRRNIVVNVGAAVLPQQAAQQCLPVDVGPRTGERMCALRRLATYAAQPDSEVDILRVGMEDTPYSVGRDGALEACDNLRLTEIAQAELAVNGVEVEHDPERVFHKLGLGTVQDRLSAAQRASPLGHEVTPRVETAPSPGAAR